ncbi:hypothetical protein NL676_003966 [Syzygium grande]|nr:hypothetical protein NL676_003966 [Syzygium grande]
MMDRSRINEETYGLRLVLEGHKEAPSLPEAYLEVNEVFHQSVGNVFFSNRVAPSEIDILIVNVSLFSRVPALTSSIVKRFKLRDDIKTFNLSGTEDGSTLKMQ